MPPLSEFVRELKKIWNNKQLTNCGEHHDRLEIELATYLGVKHVALFCNGTIALMTAIKALDLSGEVITTPFTFAATAHALTWLGIKPVFSDIEIENFNLHPDQLERKITDKTTAILPVHVFGNPCEVDKIQAVADRFGLKVIYDAAHAFGVRHKDQSVLNFGDLSVMSFHATKLFNTMEGGAVICHDEEMYKKLKRLRNFGFDNYENIDVGINGKMSEAQAAFGLLQLRYMSYITRWREIARQTYEDNLKCCIFGNSANNSYMPVLVADREAVMSRLEQSEVYARKYFHPLLTDLPMYKDDGEYPVARYISSRVLCLPIYPDIRETEIKEICKIICDE